MSAAFVKVIADLGLLDGEVIAPVIIKPEPLISERAVDESRRLKVIYIGAGISGIVAAIKFKAIPNIGLTLYEKNADVGGTWFENTYPGIACDLSAHAYQLSFESSPNWDSFFATGPEILRYWQRVVEKYDVKKNMRFNHQCIEARWNEATSKWAIKLEELTTGEIFEDTADVFITGIGILNKWKLPNIKGLNEFEGPILHTAHWDSKFDPKGKDVAVIGSGSSGIQVLPEMQAVARKVDHYIRSPTWIASTVRHEELFKRGNLGNFKYTDAEKEAWIKDPASYVEYRRYLEANLQGGYGLVQRGSKWQRGIRKLFEMDMKKRLARKPEVSEFLVPNFSPICKRLTPGPGYLEALAEENVNVIHTPISHIDHAGIVTSDGQHHLVQAIICATGFDTTFLGTFPIYGRGGVRLQDKRKDRHSSYISIGIDGFPNFFQSLGPNGGLGNGNLIVMIEYICDYFAKCLQKMSTQNILSMEPKKSAVADFTKFCEVYHERTVFGEECMSWYKTAPENATPEERRRGRVTAVWPGSSLHACRVFQNPRFEDYEVEYVDSNKFGWFGNGWTHAEKVDDPAGRSYYLNENMKFIEDDLSMPEVAATGHADTALNGEDGLKQDGAVNGEEGIKHKGIVNGIQV